MPIFKITFIEISFETNKLFDYKLYKVVNKNTILLDEIFESDGMYVFIDNKIDSNKIEYYYERKQKFLTNKIEVSNIISLYPDEKKIFKNENKAKKCCPKINKKEMVCIKKYQNTCIVLTYLL